MAETVDFPVAMEPVRPMRSIVMVPRWGSVSILHGSVCGDGSTNNGSWGRTELASTVLLLPGTVTSYRHA